MSPAGLESRAVLSPGAPQMPCVHLGLNIKIFD